MAAYRTRDREDGDDAWDLRWVMMLHTGTNEYNRSGLERKENTSIFTYWVYGVSGTSM